MKKYIVIKSTFHYNVFCRPNHNGDQAMLQTRATYEDQSVTITIEDGKITFQQVGTLPALPISMEMIIDAAIDIERKLRQNKVPT